MAIDPGAGLGGGGGTAGGVEQFMNARGQADQHLQAAGLPAAGFKHRQGLQHRCFKHGPVDRAERALGGVTADQPLMAQAVDGAAKHLTLVTAGDVIVEEPADKPIRPNQRIDMQHKRCCQRGDAVFVAGADRGIACNLTQQISDKADLLAKLCLADVTIAERSAIN